MRPLPCLVVPLVVMLVLAGCMAPSGPAFADDWQAEAAAHGEMGLEAELELQGDTYVVTASGTTESSVLTTFTIHPGSRLDDPERLWVDHPAAGPDAFLMLEGADIQVEEGRIMQAPWSMVRMLDGGLTLHFDPSAQRADKPAVAFSESMADEEDAYFFAKAASAFFEADRVSGVDRVVLLPGDGTSEELDDVPPIDGTVLVWDRRATVTADEATLHWRADRMAFALGPTGGTFTLADRPDAPLPNGLVAHDGSFVFHGDGVRSIRPFQVTQVMADGAFLLDAAVEVRPAEDHVTVQEGETEWLQVAYREHGYVGDAVFDSIHMAGDGTPYVDVPLARPPLWIEEMLQIVEETEPAWAKAWVAMVVVMASPAILFADAVGAVACALTFCPTDFPYPVWMDAGDVGDFYVRIDAAGAPPGDYQVQVTLEGANHDPVTFPVSFTVEPAS